MVGLDFASQDECDMPQLRCNMGEVDMVLGLVIGISVLAAILYFVGVGLAACALGDYFNIDDSCDQWAVGILALVWPATLIGWLIIQLGKFGQDRA
jgi:hypothetical protein